jgi:hypothetical protein
MVGTPVVDWPPLKRACRCLSRAALSSPPGPAARASPARPRGGPRSRSRPGLMLSPVRLFASVGRRRFRGAVQRRQKDHGQESTPTFASHYMAEDRMRRALEMIAEVHAGVDHYQARRSG